MLDITMHPSMYQTYPHIRLGLLTFQTNVKPSDNAFWNHMQTHIYPQVKTTYADRLWANKPGIQGSRKAYKAFGIDPGRHRVSSEALVRRVLRNEELYRINSVVDVNNLISLTTGLSLGSYDMDKIQGQIVYRQAGNEEGYQGIGKSFLNMETMPVLADDVGIFGSSMSDSMRTMVTDTSKNILVVVYCFEEEIDLAKVLFDCTQAFSQYANAQNCVTWIL